MAVSIRWVLFGEEAVAALHREITEAQSEDPMAPVTAIVGRGALGLATRRRLASGAFDSPQGLPGVRNVRFVTAERLAEEIAGAELSEAGRYPSTEAVLHTAVRCVLATQPGPVFGPVREHPATVRALAAAYRDLRGASAATRTRLAAQSPRAAEVVRLVDEARPLMDGFYDSVDLFDTATRLVRAGAGPGLGQVIWYLPMTVTPGEERLVVALAESGRVPVLVGRTGVSSADETATALVARLGVDATPTSLVGPDRSVSVRNAPTADAEVLATLRDLMAANEDGVAFERMAIVYAGGPYPRLVREVLTEAGIPFNGTGARPLSSTVAGRTLLGLFELAEQDWSRDHVMAWMAGAPTVVGDRLLEWDRISRQAGVVSGFEDWLRHLGWYENAQRARQAEEDPAESEEAARRRRRACAQNIEGARSLAAFLQSLAALFTGPKRQWSEWTSWAVSVLDDFLGEPDENWPPAEVEALTSMHEILKRLSLLDKVPSSPDLSDLRAALELELEAPAPQTTRFGRGVLVGRVTEAVGLDLEVLYVLGMCDGAFPTRVTDDPTLPDEERAAAGSDLALRAGRPGDFERDYLAALRSAHHPVLSFARDDQSHGRALRPSRWLLDALGGLRGGGRLYARDLEHLEPFDAYCVLPSFTATVGGPGEPISLADRDLRSLLRWREATGTLSGHPLTRSDPVLASGLLTRRERRRPGFSRFDGAIDPGLVDIPSPATGADQSATGLERYAQCPRRYLFSSLLRLEERPTPEAVVRISALDRGRLVHAVLETFLARQTSRPEAARISPQTPWSLGDHEEIEAIAAAIFQQYEEEGLVGRPLLWRFDRAAIVADLHEFLRRDDQHRQDRGAVPWAVEFAFSSAAGTPVEVEAANGQRVSFRGLADRIDRAEDGTLLVLDYKTGKKHELAGRLAADPVDHGTRLQLPIYALAARRGFGADAPVEAHYWYVSALGGFEQIGFAVGHEELGRFAHVLGVIVSGIEAGAFPGRPGKAALLGFDNCRWCAFDPICPTDRDRAWERARNAPELADYVALAEPPPGPAA